MSNRLSHPAYKAGLFLPAFAALLLKAGTASGGTLLFSDNFNAGNNTLDASEQGPDRYAGLLAGTTVVRAALAQSNIVDQKLAITGSDSAIRFVESPDLTVRRNFAEGATGAAIRAGGGFRIEFDHAQTLTSDQNWVGVAVGSVFNGDAWIADSRVDCGFLLRNNGNAQRFDNGISADIINSYTPSLETRHYVFEFRLDPAAEDPFADGANVTASTSVDGVPVIMGLLGETAYPFQWDANNGVIQIQVLWSYGGGYVDNLTISSTDGGTEVTPPGPLNLAVNLDGGTVTGSFSGTPGSTYTLQRSTSLLEESWINIGNPVTAPATGEVVITDSVPPAGRAFYRIAYAP